jgi:hypothetical protein
MHSRLWPGAALPRQLCPRVGQRTHPSNGSSWRSPPNEFRWKRPDLTKFYISQIAQIAIHCEPTSDIILSRCPSKQRCVIVIDTQGAESLVLRGLFARHGVNPVLITYEDYPGFVLGNFLRLWLRGFKCVEIGLNITFVMPSHGRDAH